MPNLILWGERELDKLRRDMDRLFDHMFLDFGLPARTPEFGRMQLVDQGDTLAITVFLPGVQPQDLDLEVTERDLRLEAKGPTSGPGSLPGTGLRRRLRRSVEFPCAIDPDEVSARFKDEVLTISLPKTCRPHRTTIPLSDA